MRIAKVSLPNRFTPALPGAVAEIRASLSPLFFIVNAGKVAVVGQFEFGNFSQPWAMALFRHPKTKRKPKAKAKRKRNNQDFSQIALAVVHKATGTKLKHR
jgi:hypothetical protein